MPLPFLAYDPSLLSKARENRHNPSEPERRVWGMLRGKQFEGLKFLRQKPIDRYIVDFYCAELRLAIEIDGDSHAEQVSYDEERTKQLAHFGVAIIRYTNREVMENLDGLYLDLQERIEKRRSQSDFPLIRGIEGVPNKYEAARQDLRGSGEPPQSPLSGGGLK